MGAVPGYKVQLQLTSTPSVAFTNEAMTNPLADNINYQIVNSAHRWWDDSVSVVVQSGLPSIQTISITGAPTGGSFTLTFGGNTTAAINWNATASQVQSALVALASIGANNVVVTGGPGPSVAWVVTFAGSKAPGAQAAFTHTDSFTGGSSPAASIAQTQIGTSYATVSASTYQLVYGGGLVIFNTALTGTGPLVQALSGNYYPASLLAMADTCDMTFQNDVKDVTTFSATTTSPFRTYQALLFGWTTKLDKYWVDMSLLQTFLLGSPNPVVKVGFACYMGQSGTNRFEGFAWLKSDGFKIDVKDFVKESLDLQGNNQFTFYS